MAAIPPLTQISLQHNSIYENYFRQLNPSGTGTIGAADAAAFLKKSSLPEGTLHIIWDLADQGSKGYLDKQGFFIALKLISTAQSGKEPSLTCLTLPSPPPIMGDSPRQPHHDMSMTDKPGWAIKAKEKQQYDGIFDSLKPINGLVSGDKVKPVLINSKLPFDVLGKIWDMSDIDKDGSLDRDEFAVAMYLVYHALDGEQVPVTLPHNLIPPSKRNASIRTSLPSSSASIGLAQTPTFSSLTPEQAWVVSAADKMKYEAMFLHYDTDNDGLVSGVEVKDVLIASGLPQNILAHIWGLCDINNTGQLNSEQFALAMYLISQQKSGKELPQSLSTDLMPPSSQTTAANVLLKKVESAGNDFSAIKELDKITTDIEQLGREKASLQLEINQTEEAIRKRKTEIEDLQHELEKANKGLEILNQQKKDAQSRLNDLDSEKSKYKDKLKDVQSKCTDEEQMLGHLRTQLTSQQTSVKEQEEELLKGRKELESIRKEEAELEQQIEENRKNLEGLKAKLSTNKNEISQTQAKIEKLNEENNSIKEEISQLNSLQSNTAPSTALNDFNYAFETRFKDVDQISARATAGSSPVSSISGFSIGSSGKIDEEGDDFKENDLFKSKTDPFGTADNDSTDPFNADDPFKSDPFKTVSFAEDPFSGDPFQNNDPFRSDPFKTSDKADSPSDNEKSNADPFGTLDPFVGSAFSTTTTKNVGFTSSKATTSVKTDISDPFASNDAFGSTGTINSLPQANAKTSTSSDPFSSNPFGTSDPFASTNNADPFSTTMPPSDLFSSTSSADPFSTPVPNDPFSTSSNPSVDPFVTTKDSDPFSSASSSTLTDPNDPWFAFGAEKSSTTTPGNTTSKSSKKEKHKTGGGAVLSEDKQLEWAKRESEREEAERQRRLKEMSDREEMEIALALKQSVESSSDA